MKRTRLLIAATGTVLATAGAAIRLRRRTVPAAAVTAGRPQEDRWGELPPCPPPREGVAYLHDWLASGDWSEPGEVLQALREQAPARLLADLARDLATDLNAAGHHGSAARAREAEQLLRRAADLLGEYDDADLDEDGSPCPDEPHPGDCPGGCGGDGVLMEIMTWDDQGDGIYVPVHQEPVECPGDQEPAPHPEDCVDCAGTGFTFEGGYRHLCLRSRLPAPHPPVDDPWASAPAYSVGDTCPF